MINKKNFWEKRLNNNFNLSGVGHTGFSYNYNKWMYKIIKDGMDDILKINLKNKKILDIGSGTGFWIDYFLKKGAMDITGLDITSISINTLQKQYPTLRFYQEDISGKISLRMNYDIIVAMAVLHHIIGDNDFENAIKNIRKLAKKGSLILIQDNFLKKYQPKKSGTHSYPRTYKEYKRVLEKNTIRIIKKVPIVFFLNPPYDINNNFVRNISLFLWNRIMSIFAKNEFAGNIMGVILYCIDKIILKVVNDSISSEILVCKVE